MKKEKKICLWPTVHFAHCKDLDGDRFIPRSFLRISVHMCETAVRYIYMAHGRAPLWRNYGERSNIVEIAFIKMPILRNLALCRCINIVVRNMSGEKGLILYRIFIFKHSAMVEKSPRCETRHFFSPPFCGRAINDRSVLFNARKYVRKRRTQQKSKFRPPPATVTAMFSREYFCKLQNWLGISLRQT